MQKEIVFTGKFEIDGEHIVRELLVEAANEKGYFVSKKVSFNTDILVLGNTGKWATTRKQQDAEMLGVKVMSAEEFFATL